MRTSRQALQFFDLERTHVQTSKQGNSRLKLSAGAQNKRGVPEVEVKAWQG